MKKRNNFTLTLVASAILIFTILAVVETVNLSSKTVDEAFEKFIENELKAENEVGKQVFYPHGDDVFVVYEMNDRISLVQFEQGVLSWKRKYYSHYENEGYSYSSNSELFHGVIPKDIVTETKNIQVNGKDADIVMLNDQSRIWIMAENQNKDTFDNIKIEFLDEAGNVIAEM